VISLRDEKVVHSSVHRVSHPVNPAIQLIAPFYIHPFLKPLPPYLQVFRLSTQQQFLSIKANILKMAIPASNGKTVLITGINGYIASVLGLRLLEKGYSLRGTSRRTASVEPLLKGPYAAYQDRVKVYEVSDMTVAGAFDEAAKGTTSPLSSSEIMY
jgi:hypothetical protein